MDELIKNLAPLFVAGLAVQQLIEVPDAFLSSVPQYEKYKKLVVKLVALAFGILLAVLGEFHVLRTVGAKIPSGIDTLVAGLIVSGGTESFNSIVKFLGYAKESRKAAAATATDAAGALALQQMKWK